MASDNHPDAGLERAVAIAAGLVLFRLAFSTKLAAAETTPVLATMVVLALYGTGIAAIVTAVASVDRRRWVPKIGLAAGLAATAAVYVHILVATQTPHQIGSDSLLYAQYSAEVLLNGHNPYSASMLPAFDQYNTVGQGTPTVDGTTVESVIYPAGSIIVFVPQLAAGVTNGNVTLLAVFLGLLAFLVWQTPDEYALAPILVVFASPRLLGFSSGGIIDVLWVLPVVVAMHYWARDNYHAAGVAFGIALACKQQPWLILPFLVVWLAIEAPSRPLAVARLRRFLAPAAGVFLAVNLPFLVWNPGAYLTSIGRAFGLFGPSLVMRGSGLVSLTTSGVLPAPATTYTILAGVVAAALLAAYALYWRWIPWLAWITPAIILFAAPRGLHNYYLMIVPVAYYAALLDSRIDTPATKGAPT